MSDPKEDLDAALDIHKRILDEATKLFDKTATPALSLPDRSQEVDIDRVNAILNIARFLREGVLGR